MSGIGSPGVESRPMPALVGVGLTCAQLAAVAADARLVRRLDESDLAFSVLGIDRVDGSPPSAPALDPWVTAAVLSARTRYARLLVAAAPRRDHPYNLARRLASLGHLSHGRTGVLLGSSDVHSPPGRPWTDPTDVPSPAALLGEIVRAVRSLERSWPFDSVIADRRTGIFAQSDRISRVDHDGIYRIAGPLTVPEPAAGPSVIGVFGGEVVGGDEVDLVVGRREAYRVVGLDPTAVPNDAVAVVVSAADASPADVLAAADALTSVGRRAPRDSTLRAALEIAIPPRSPGSPAFERPAPLPIPT